MSASLLAQARQGNPDAIAALLNKKLKPKGVTVEVARYGTALDIVLTGKKLPPQASAIPFLLRSFARLDNIPIFTLNVIGQKYGTDRDMWRDTITLPTSDASFPPTMATSANPKTDSSISKTASPDVDLSLPDAVNADANSSPLEAEADLPNALETAPVELALQHPSTHFDASASGLEDDLALDSSVLDSSVLDSSVLDSSVLDSSVLDSSELNSPAPNEPSSEELFLDDLFADEPPLHEPSSDESLLGKPSSEELFSDELSSEVLVPDKPSSGGLLSNEPALDAIPEMNDGPIESSPYLPTSYQPLPNPRIKTSPTRRPLPLPRGRFPYWLEWQWTNLKGGLLFLFVLLIVVNVLNLVLGEGLNLQTDERFIPSLILAGIFSWLLGGLFIGDSQAFCMKKYRPSSNGWRWATFAGFTLGGILTSLLQTFGYPISSFLFVTVPPLGLLVGFFLIMLGGVLLGAMLSFCQWIVLRPHVKYAHLWIAWSCLAGLFSFLLGAVIGLVVAWQSYLWADRLGFDMANSIFLTVLATISVSTVVSWVSYHGISGYKMADFMAEMNRPKNP